MAVGELIVSLFPDKILIELFKVKSKKVVLVRKHFEKYNVSFSDFSKIDVLEIEKIVDNFITKTDFKGGKLYINVFASENQMDFKEFDFDTTSKKDIVKMLPFELESLGDKYDNMNHTYDIIGNKVKVYFLSKNIVDSLSEIKLSGSWDLLAVTPGYLIYQGIVQGDAMLVDIHDDGYDVYSFKGGYIKDREQFGYSGIDFENTTPNDVFEIVKEDLIQYVRNLNFSEGMSLDYVHVVFNDNFVSKFESVEDSGYYFESPRDLRDKLTVNGDPLEHDIAKSFKPECKLFNYSSVALGTFYNSKEIMKVSFSKERLSHFYRNILLTTMTFTIFACAALPSVSILADNRLGGLESNVDKLNSSVQTYEQTIKGLQDEVDSKDSLINDYNSYVSSLGGLTDSNRNFVSDVLAYLPSNTPTTILVNTVVLDKDSKTLVISGISSNYKDIGSFAIELEEFGNVSINSIEDKELLNVSGYPFEIKLKSK